MMPLPVIVSICMLVVFVVHRMLWTMSKVGTWVWRVISVFSIVVGGGGIYFGSGLVQGGSAFLTMAWVCVFIAMFKKVNDKKEGQGTESEDEVEYLYGIGADGTVFHFVLAHEVVFKSGTHGIVNMGDFEIIGLPIIKSGMPLVFNGLQKPVVEVVYDEEEEP